MQLHSQNNAMCMGMRPAACLMTDLYMYIERQMWIHKFLQDGPLGIIAMPHHDNVGIGFYPILLPRKWVQGAPRSSRNLFIMRRKGSWERLQKSSFELQGVPGSSCKCLAC